jgi:hypothetical protein
VTTKGIWCIPGKKNVPGEAGGRRGRSGGMLTSCALSKHGLNPFAHRHSGEARHSQSCGEQ